LVANRISPLAISIIQFVTEVHFSWLL